MCVRVVTETCDEYDQLKYLYYLDKIDVFLEHCTS